MKSRHRARETALQILYQYDLNFTPTLKGGTLENASLPLPSQQQLVFDLSHHYDHFLVPENLREFIGELVAGTLLNLAKIDEVLEKHASNWKISRMSAVDRSLLRMAAYEMVFLKKTPASVVIDEAVELAKEFGTEDTPAFINGILDGMKTSHERESL